MMNIRVLVLLEVCMQVRRPEPEAIMIDSMSINDGQNAGYQAQSGGQTAATTAQPQDSAA